jgi:hypothetical protein
MTEIHKQLTPVQIPVPLGDCIPTGSGAVFAREAAGQYSISFPTANTAYQVQIPVAGTFPIYLAAQAGFGFRLEEVLLWYSVGAVNASACTFAIYQETMTPNSTRAAATTFGGTLALAVDDGARGAPVAQPITLPTTQRANLYLVSLKLGSPAFLTTSRQDVNAEFTLTTGATSGTGKLHAVVLVGTFRLI